MGTRKTVIIMVRGQWIETHGSLKSLCESHTSFSYSYLKGLKFPFTYKDWYILKSPILKK